MIKLYENALALIRRDQAKMDQRIEISSFHKSNHRLRAPSGCPGALMFEGLIANQYGFLCSFPEDKLTEISQRCCSPGSKPSLGPPR